MCIIIHTYLLLIDKRPGYTVLNNNNDKQRLDCATIITIQRFDRSVRILIGVNLPGYRLDAADAPVDVYRGINIIPNLLSCAYTIICCKFIQRNTSRARKPAVVRDWGGGEGGQKRRFRGGNSNAFGL